MASPSSTQSGTRAASTRPAGQFDGAFLQQLELRNIDAMKLLAEISTTDDIVAGFAASA